MNRTDRQLLKWYASTFPQGHSERIAIQHHLKISESFVEEIHDKTFPHPKTKEQVKFVSLPLEEQKRIREQYKKEKGEEPQADSEKVESWLEKAKNLSNKAKETLKNLPKNAQKFVADSEYRKEIKSKAVEILKEEKDKLIDQAIKSTTTQFTDVSDGVKAIMGGDKPTGKQVKATLKLALKVSAASGVAALAGGVGTAAGAAAGAGTLISSLFVNTVAGVFTKRTDLEARMTEFIKGNLPTAETLESKYKNLNDWLKQVQGAFEEMGVDIGAEELVEGAVSLVVSEEKKADEDTKEFIGILSAMMLEMVSEENMSDEVITKTLNDMSEPSPKKVAHRYLSAFE